MDSHFWKLECRSQTWTHTHTYSNTCPYSHSFQAHIYTLILTNAHIQMHTFIYSHRYPLFLINWKSMVIKAHGQNPYNSQCSIPGDAKSGTKQGLQPLTCSDLTPGWRSKGLQAPTSVPIICSLYLHSDGRNAFMVDTVKLAHIMFLYVFNRFIEV